MTLALVLLAGLASAGKEGVPLLTLEPGADAPGATRDRDGALEIRLDSIHGATIRYDEAARLTYTGEAPALVRVALHAGPAWSTPVAGEVALSPGASLPIPIVVALAEGEKPVGPARLIATIVP